MLKIIMRSLLGAGIGFAIYIWSKGNSAPDAGHMLFFIVWGIGMGNSIMPCLKIIEKALGWAANLSIISFFSLGTGVLGFVLLLLVLGFVLSIGWLGGWFILIHDMVNELR